MFLPKSLQVAPKYPLLTSKYQSASFTNDKFSYMPPESIYISEVKKTYETTSSYDLQQTLPTSTPPTSQRTSNDPNESGYQSDSIGFRTFEQRTTSA